MRSVLYGKTLWPVISTTLINSPSYWFDTLHFLSGYPVSTRQLVTRCYLHPHPKAHLPYYRTYVYARTTQFNTTQHSIAEDNRSDTPHYITSHEPYNQRNTFDYPLLFIYRIIWGPWVRFRVVWRTSRIGWVVQKGFGALPERPQDVIPIVTKAIQGGISSYSPQCWCAYNTILYYIHTYWRGILIISTSNTLLPSLLFSHLLFFSLLFSSTLFFLRWTNVLRFPFPRSTMFYTGNTR